MKRILTIAGSDSGGGAGIQADLKVITSLGGYGMSVLTALTAQNTVGVQGIHEVPVPFVEAQIESVLSDIGADAIKTGMLGTAEIVEVVARKIRQYGVERVVVDPVMLATSGDVLLRKDGHKALIRQLIPLATVVTPNLREAFVLSGIRVNSIGEMKKAAYRIYGLGAKYVVVKGGHLRGAAVDLLYDGRKFDEIRGPRIKTENTHGTGCVFASAIATLLARGDTVREAVIKAKSFMTMAIQGGIRVGKGTGPTNPFAYVLREMERYRVIEELKKTATVLKGAKVGYLIPEVSSNLGYALPHAEGIEDVAAFPGRIVRLKESIATLRDPEFGASKYIANTILEVMKFDPEYCSAMNIRFSRENIGRLKKEGLLIGHFDRRSQSKRTRQKEDSLFEGGVGEVLKKLKRVPDCIYDEGDIGREPMVRVLGRDPQEVIHKILKLANSL